MQHCEYASPTALEEQGSSINNTKSKQKYVSTISVIVNFVQLVLGTLKTLEARLRRHNEASRMVHIPHHRTWDETLAVAPCGKGDGVGLGPHVDFSLAGTSGEPHAANHDSDCHQRRED